MRDTSAGNTDLEAGRIESELELGALQIADNNRDARCVVVILD